MLIKIIGVIVLLSACLVPRQIQAQEPPKIAELTACQTVDVECRLYLQGLVDGALMYFNEPSIKPLSVHDFEARALKFRAGGRYKSLNKAYCTQHTIGSLELALAIEEQVSLKEITSLDEMKVFMSSVLSCNNR